MWPEIGTSIEVYLAGEGEIEPVKIQGELFQVNQQHGLAVVMEAIVPNDYASRPAPLRPAILYQTHLINLGAVHKVVTTSPTSEPSPHPKELPMVQPLRVDRLLRREQKNIAKRQREFGAMAPPGTSEEAKAIFGALSKT